MESVRISFVTTTPSNKPQKHPCRAPGLSSASSNDLARRALSVLAMLLGVAALGASNPPAGSAASPAAPATTRIASADSATARRPAIMFAQTLAQRLAQDDDDDGGADAAAGQGASREQIEKYVAVYRAMQRDHSMTIEQAAAAQGFTVAAFRDLEQRIESDDLSRDQARRALAAPPQSATPSATTKPPR